MACPTITSITPSTGPAGGRIGVTIDGTNFNTPSTPTDGSDWKNSVKVTFNGVESAIVKPYSATEVWCILPKYTGTPSDTAIVDVVVTNLDEDEEEIDGETVTSEDGFTYTRQGASQTYQGIAWLVKYITLDMRRQLIDSVVPMSANPDYDPNQSTTEIELEDVPAFLLSFQLSDKGYSMRNQTVESGNSFVNRIKPNIYNVEFTVRCVASKNIELLYLKDAYIDYIQRTSTISIPTTVSDSDSSTVDFYIQETKPPVVTSEATNSPLPEFTASFNVPNVSVCSSYDILPEKRDAHGYIWDTTVFTLSNDID